MKIMESPASFMTIEECQTSSHKVEPEIDRMAQIGRSKKADLGSRQGNQEIE
jgi:hypothetical protein